MGLDEISALIKEAFSQDTILELHDQGIQPFLLVTTEKIAEICQWLHTHPNMYFDCLSCLTGVDNGPEKGTIEVVYHLFSITKNISLVLKVREPRLPAQGQLPVVPSIANIWASANWHEREAYDLLGIYFEGHPDLRRILLPADWEGYPLRKDYQLQDYYHGIKTSY